MSAASPGHTETLLVAASLASPEASLVEAALGRQVQGDLDRAEQAGVARVRDGRVHFDHPLKRRLSPARQNRRAAHRALAAVVVEPEQHARHLALAASQPDEEVAAALGTAAEAAAARGSPGRCRRTGRAGMRVDALQPLRRTRRAAFVAGGVSGSGPAMQTRPAVSPGSCSRLCRPGRLRARAAELSARVLHVAGTAADAAEYCIDALADAGADPELEARMHATLALVSWHDFRLAREHAQQALRLLDAGGVQSPEVQLRASDGLLSKPRFTPATSSRRAGPKGPGTERLAPCRASPTR